LKDGDVIVSFNGKKVDKPDDLRDLVGDTEPGEEIEVEVFRNGKTQTLKIVMGEWPEDMSWITVGDLGFNGDDLREHLDNVVQAFSAKPRLGVEVFDLNEDLAPYFKTKANEGVLVLKVKDESVAGDAGVVAGDVIVKVGEEKVTSVDDLRESVEDYEDGDEFPIQVVRKGKKKTLTATMDDSANVMYWSGEPNVWNFRKHAPGMYKYRVDVPRVKVDVDDDIREELDQMKKELKAMRKELKELKK
jgi:predicted metalloprotease with PDZ domain